MKNESPIFQNVYKIEKLDVVKLEVIVIVDTVKAVIIELIEDNNVHKPIFYCKPEGLAKAIRTFIDDNVYPVVIGDTGTIETVNTFNIDPIHFEVYEYHPALIPLLQPMLNRFSAGVVAWLNGDNQILEPAEPYIVTLRALLEERRQVNTTLEKFRNELMNSCKTFILNLTNISSPDIKWTPHFAHNNETPYEYSLDIPDAFSFRVKQTPSQQLTCSIIMAESVHAALKGGFLTINIHSQNEKINLLEGILITDRRFTRTHNSATTMPLGDIDAVDFSYYKP